MKQAAFDLSNYPDRPPVRSMFSGKTVPGSRDGIDEAINAINEVHRLPVDVADVEVVATPWFDAGSGTMGAFNPTSMGSARPSIFLRDDIAASMKSETLVHEFGHYIDYEVLGEAASSGMNGTGVLKGVMQAIKDSTSYRDFLDIQRAGYVMVEAVDGTVTKAVLEPEFIEYVLKPDELWARAYAQYIGTHSSNPLINEAIADLTYSEKNRFLPYQWKADDFAAIEREITKAMEALGWLLK